MSSTGGTNHRWIFLSIERLRFAQSRHGHGGRHSPVSVSRYDINSLSAMPFQSTQTKNFSIPYVDAAAGLFPFLKVIPPRDDGEAPPARTQRRGLLAEGIPVSWGRRAAGRVINMSLCFQNIDAILLTSSKSRNINYDFCVLKTIQRF